MSAPQTSRPRAVPANLDIEANVLGCVMTDPSLLDGRLGLEPSDFYWESHKNIWSVILALHRAGRRPFEPAVRDEIEARGWQDRTQGRDEAGNMLGNCGYLSVLTRLAYTPVFDEAVDKLLELSRCRSAIDACYRTANKLEAGSVDSEDILRDLQDDARRLIERGTRYRDAQPLTELATATAERALLLQPDAQPMPKFSTGFEWLDYALCGGFQPEDFTIVGARPGTGKTKVALYMLAAACAAGTKVGLISLDMGQQRLMPYIIPAFANKVGDIGITSRNVHDPLSDGEIGAARLRDACLAVDPENRCLVVSDPRSFSINAVSGYARYLADQGCQLILLDQLQDISEWADGAGDRGVYHAIFHELRINICRRRGVAMIVLHQINRQGSDRPGIKDLKDTGCAEEFVDTAILLHDYQRVLIDTCGGFVMQGDRPRAPRQSDSLIVHSKPMSRRVISVHLAKSRSSSVERNDVWFDYALGIAP